MPRFKKILKTITNLQGKDKGNWMVDIRQHTPSETKTNRATDGEQFIKSNAATARPLIFVRPAEI